MHLDEKGQVSAELLLVTVVVIILAGSLVNFASSGMDKSDTGNLAQVRIAGEQVAETINTVYTNGNGYSANLTLPNLKSSYTVYVYSNGSINVIYNTKNITIKLIPQNSIQSFSMTNGTSYQVTNDNGNITFT